HSGKQLTYGREQPCIGSRITARCASDGALIDTDDLVKMLEPFQCRIGCRLSLGTMQFLCNGIDQRVVDQGGFTGTRNVGDADQPCCGQKQVDRLQVVAGAAFESQPVLFLSDRQAFGNDDLQLAAEVLAGQGMG